MRNVLQAIIAMLLIEVCMAPSESFAEPKSWPDSRHVLHNTQRPFTAYCIADSRMQKPAASIVFGIDMCRIWTVISPTILRLIWGDTTQPVYRTDHESTSAGQPLHAPMGIDDVPALDGSARHTNPASTGS